MIELTASTGSMAHLSGEVYQRVEGVLRRRTEGGPNAIYRVASPSRLGRRSGDRWSSSWSVDSLCRKTPNRRGADRSIFISGQETIHEVRRSLPPVRSCMLLLSHLRRR